MPRLCIRWSIDDAEWTKANGLNGTDDIGYTIGELAMFDLLYGEVQFTYDSSDLFPAHILLEIVERGLNNRIQRGLTAPPPPSLSELTGDYLSLVDLAIQLARILEQGFAATPDRSTAIFRQSDDKLEVTFTKVGGDVVITSNVFSERHEPPRLLVPLPEFTHDAYEHAPDMFEWDVFTPLRLYLPQS